MNEVRWSDRDHMGGVSPGPASDVDLLLVLRDDASQEDRRRVLADVERLEANHMFVDPSSPASWRPR